MVLSEAGLPARRYHIDGVDISARRLTSARRGVYSKNAFRGAGAFVFEALLQAASRRVRDRHRSCGTTVQFIQGSILDPRLLEGLPPYDLVFCRNLLIYLTHAARAALLDRIDKLLAPDGVLLIGHADRLDLTGAESRFTATGESGCFAYRRIVSRDARVATVFPSLEVPSANSGLLAPAPIHAIHVTAPQENVQALQRPILTTTENAVPAEPEPSFLLGEASELANQGAFHRGNWAL